MHCRPAVEAEQTHYNTTPAAPQRERISARRISACNRLSLIGRSGFHRVSLALSCQRLDLETPCVASRYHGQTAPHIHVRCSALASFYKATISTLTSSIILNHQFTTCLRKMCINHLHHQPQLHHQRQRHLRMNQRQQISSHDNRCHPSQTT